MKDKVGYVLNQASINTNKTHHCHWPGCQRVVAPAMWGCKTHWFMLPMNLRTKIWATYKPGQEITKTPSIAYLQAANEVQAWIQTQMQGMRQ